MNRSIRFIREPIAERIYLDFDFVYKIEQIVKNNFHIKNK